MRTLLSAPAGCYSGLGPAARVETQALEPWGGRGWAGAHGGGLEPQGGSPQVGASLTVTGSVLT